MTRTNSSTPVSLAILAHCTARQRARIRAAGYATPQAGHAFVRQAVAEYVAKHGTTLPAERESSASIKRAARPATYKRRTTR